MFSSGDALVALEEGETTLNLPLVESKTNHSSKTQSADAAISTNNNTYNKNKTKAKKTSFDTASLTKNRRSRKKKTGGVSSSKNKKSSSNAAAKQKSQTMHSNKVGSITPMNMTANQCQHCLRVFCGRKALYVHTLKMHGKGYLQRDTPSNTGGRSKKNPFSCWFCSAHFASPQLVVTHMTQAHENLDRLSKRVEQQENEVDCGGRSQPSGPLGQQQQQLVKLNLLKEQLIKGTVPSILPSGTQDSSAIATITSSIPHQLPRFIPIPTPSASTNQSGTAQKQKMMSVASLRSSSTSLAVSAASIIQPHFTNAGNFSNINIPRKAEPGQQPPAGFKVSYALAYVPVYVPDGSSTNHGDVVDAGQPAPLDNCNVAPEASKNINIDNVDGKKTTN